MTRIAELISYVTTLMNSNDTTTSVFSTAQGGALTEKENGTALRTEHRCWSHCTAYIDLSVGEIVEARRETRKRRGVVT